MRVRVDLFSNLSEGRVDCGLGELFTGAKVTTVLYKGLSTASWVSPGPRIIPVALERSSDERG